METRPVDEWARDNIREMRHELEDIRREVRGRTGDTNGGGIAGGVKRVEKRVNLLQTLVLIGVIANLFWVLAAVALAWLVFRFLLP